MIYFPLCFRLNISNDGGCGNSEGYQHCEEKLAEISSTIKTEFQKIRCEISDLKALISQQGNTNSKAFQMPQKSFESASTSEELSAIVNTVV